MMFSLEHECAKHMEPELLTQWKLSQQLGVGRLPRAVLRDCIVSSAASSGEMLSRAPERIRTVLDRSGSGPLDLSWILDLGDMAPLG